MAAITDIARYTVLRLLQNGNSISHLKLQKMLYYIQAWYMVYFDKEKIFEEAPEAWVNGPVYKTIYEIYKNKGIYEQLNYEDASTTLESIMNDLENLHEKINIDNNKWDFFEAIFKHYGTMSHDKLVFLTHSQRPWNEARKGLEPFEYSEKKIDLDSMYEYYKESIEK